MITAENHMILVIISDPKISSHLEKQILKPFGYEVRLAANEKHGLELALVENPDMVLVGGTVISSSLLSSISIIHQSNPSIPIILVCNIDPEGIINAFRTGISDFIELPLNELKTREIIARVLAASESIRQREKDNHKLLMDEAVRITQTTLSHYLNNYLTALDGDLILLHESIHNKDPWNKQLEILKKSQRDIACIKKVIEVLVNTTSVKLTEYDDTSKMIDIDAPLLLEINRILDSDILDVAEN
jgi:response regulator RpfG family c-di-GMP phosphodiesterase